MSKKEEKKKIDKTFSKEDLKKTEEGLTRFREKSEGISKSRTGVENRSRIPTKCNGTGPRSKNDDSIK